MKKDYLYALLIFVLCLAHVVSGEGFVVDTLVSTPHGSIPIQELAIGDEVLTCTFNDSSASETVANVISHDGEAIIRLEVDGEIINVAQDQLLFVPLQRTWLPASDIRPGMYLLVSPLRAVRVHSVTKIEQKRLVHTISLNKHHNYLVGKHGIVAHNFSECAILAVEAAESATFLSAFLAANPLVAPITISVGGAGLAGYLIWTFVGEIKESRTAKRDRDKNGGGGNQPEEPQKNDSEYDPATVRAAAIALLKAIDQNKDKAVEVFNKTCEWLATDKGLQAIQHAFRDKCGHNLGPLLARMGANLSDKSDILRVGTKILMDVTQKLIAMGTKLPLKNDGVYHNIVIEYGGELITARGRIIDGIFKMSTMFIQPQHVR